MRKYALLVYELYFLCSSKPMKGTDMNELINKRWETF